MIVERARGVGGGAGGEGGERGVGFSLVYQCVCERLIYMSVYTQTHTHTYIQICIKPKLPPQTNSEILCIDTHSLSNSEIKCLKF